MTVRGIATDRAVDDAEAEAEAEVQFEGFPPPDFSFTTVKRFSFSSSSDERIIVRSIRRERSFAAQPSSSARCSELTR